MPERSRRWHRWLFRGVLIGLAVLVITRFASLQELGATLGRARWEWVAAGVAIHGIYFVAYAVLYRLGFLTVEVESRVWGLLRLVFASILVNAVAPTGGAGGAALFVDDAERRGQSGARAAAGTVLVLVIDLGTLVPFLAYGMLHLYQHHALMHYDIVAASLFVVLTIVLTAALLLARVQKERIRRVLEWLRRLINHVGGWLHWPGLVSEKWPGKAAEQFTEASCDISRHPWRLAIATAVATVLHAINLAGLYTFFLALNYPVPLGALIAGFGMGIVFFVITIVPQGVGAVEGVMALVFTSLGVPGAVAAAAIVLFRGVNYWIPLVIGAVVARQVRTFGGRTRQER